MCALSLPTIALLYEKKNIIRAKKSIAHFEDRWAHLPGREIVMR